MAVLLTVCREQPSGSIHVPNTRYERIPSIAFFAQPLTSQIPQTLDPLGLGEGYSSLAQRQNNNSSGGTTSTRLQPDHAHQNTTFISSRYVHTVSGVGGGKSICVIVWLRLQAAAKALGIHVVCQKKKFCVVSKPS